MSEQHPFSLSPITYINMPPKTKVILSSPNGATCSRLAEQVSYVFIGALLNAKAMGEAVSTLISKTNQTVTVLACGERWLDDHEDGPLRFAVEDYLGAGAILSHINLEKSPEAQVCESAFLHSRDRIEQIIRECGGGIELRDKGFGADVKHTAQLNQYDVVPYLQKGQFLPWTGE